MTNPRTAMSRIQMILWTIQEYSVAREKVETNAAVVAAVVQPLSEEAIKEISDKAARVEIQKLEKENGALRQDAADTGFWKKGRV